MKRRPATFRGHRSGGIYTWIKTCLGWALSESTQQSTDTTEIHSLIHFDRFPLEKLLPFLLRQLVLASLPHTVNTGNGGREPFAHEHRARINWFRSNRSFVPREGRAM